MVKKTFWFSWFWFYKEKKKTGYRLGFLFFFLDPAHDVTPYFGAGDTLISKIIFNSASALRLILTGLFCKFYKKLQNETDR